MTARSRSAVARGMLTIVLTFAWTHVGALNSPGTSRNSCPALKYDAFERFKAYAPDPSVALMQAVYRDDAAAVVDAIGAGADVNQAHDQRDFVCWIASNHVTEWKEPQWTFPLYEAAQGRLNPTIVGHLLDAKARPEVHPYDLDPQYVDRRGLVVRMPWSFYGRSRSAGDDSTGNRDWPPVMEQFVKHGFVLSGTYLARRPPSRHRDVAYRMLIPTERAKFDLQIASNEALRQQASAAEKSRRELADAQVSAEIADAREQAASKKRADGATLPDAIGELICKGGALSANICLHGTPLCERVHNMGTLYGYIEGASPDRQRLQIRVGGALLPRGSQVGSQYRGITFDGIDYQQGQIVWGSTNEWTLCDVTTDFGVVH